MKRSAARFALILGVIIFAPPAWAQSPDGRQESPREIEKCQTIDKSGSYRLVNNLTFTGSTGVCLSITADFVTIDLAGFAITGPGSGAPNSSIGILAMPPSGEVLEGIAVRNGSISSFGTDVDLGSGASIVEGLRVVGGRGPVQFGIIATGVVRGNTVFGIFGLPTALGVGISATGIVTGNHVAFSRGAEYQIGQGSTVIGNTALGSAAPEVVGFDVSCPSNVTDNTALNRRQGNLILNGNGCNNTNNVAP